MALICQETLRNYVNFKYIYQHPSITSTSRLPVTCCSYERLTSLTLNALPSYNSKTHRDKVRNKIRTCIGDAFE